MRYSPDGGEVEVSLSQPAPGVAELAVRDYGVGIAPEERDRIFDRFARNHAAGGSSGLGLGLYLSRRIVALHGGDMRVEFPADGGTRVVARLPLGLAADGRSQTDRPADIQADFPI
jgi:signal transduction histidine kinase